MADRKSKFTIKRIKIRNRYYVAVWSTGRRGFFSMKQYNVKKGVTVSATRKALEPSIIKHIPATLFRLLKAKIYFYKDGEKVGQLRIVIYTLKPSSWKGSLNRLLTNAEKKAKKLIRGFDKALSIHVKDTLITATEERVIEHDEFRRTRKRLDSPYVEIGGLGVTKGGIRTVGFYL